MHAFTPVQRFRGSLDPFLTGRHTLMQYRATIVWLKIETSFNHSSSFNNKADWIVLIVLIVNIFLLKYVASNALWITLLNIIDLAWRHW